METELSFIDSQGTTSYGTVEVLFLGTGASTGVPMIGCNCPVCSSENPYNDRTRSSILVRYAGKQILIDASPDLRSQSLKNKVNRIDAVIFTHPHADHVLGIDELRTFNYLQKEEIPIFGDPETLRVIMGMFPYAFSEENKGGLTRPRLVPNTVLGPTCVFGLTITPFLVKHGPVMNHALRMGKLVYLTDCNEVPEESMGYLEDVDTLVIGAVRYEPHASHFGVWQALELIDRIKPRKAYLTHLSHGIDHARLESELPPHVHASYDGLVISVL